jgi:PAS domain S-box-containing protein
VLLVYLLQLAEYRFGQNIPRPGRPLPFEASLGLVFAAWFGCRFAAGVLLSGGLLLFVHQAILHAFAGTPDLFTLGWLAVEPFLNAAEAVLAWWLYYMKGGGSRRLADPRSATLFVFTVPGLVALASALARTLVAWAIDPASDWFGLGRVLTQFYLDRALGMVIFTPPLLVLATGSLVRRGLVPSQQRHKLGQGSARTARSFVPRSPTGAGESLSPRILEEERASLGDWLEIAGLAFGASVLCLLLSGLHGRRDLLGWQLWGVQILLIVWASVRQGLRGGTLVAATAAAAAVLLPMIAGALRPPPGEDILFRPLIEAHLLAQCAGAVLVAAAASWVRAQEKGYRQIVSHIPVVIYSVRLAGYTAGRELKGVEITLVSAACSRVLGTSADALLGDYSHWLSVVQAEDREVVRAAIEQLTRQEQPVTCEYRVQGRWLRDTLAPHRDSDGRLIGWEGIVTDVSEQRTLADDLRRTTSMFNALVGNLPTGVFFIQGPLGQPILVNARARQLLGQRENPAAGLDYLSQVYRLFRPDGTIYPNEELPVCVALRDGRTTMRDDIVVHRPDGRRIPLVTWAAPVQMGGRNWSNGAVWVLEDLTALQQAEAARKETQDRLRAVVETMAEGLLVHDARGRIITCNPAACALFDLPAEKLIDRMLFDLGWQLLNENGALRSEEELPVATVLRTGRPVRNLILGARPEALASGIGAKEPSTSGVRWMLVNAMPLGQGAVTGERHVAASNSPAEAASPGKPQGVVMTFSDVSLYMLALEALRVSEERYRGLVESLPVMLIQANRNLEVTYINPATTAVTGYERSEIADPVVWSAIIHPDDLPRVQEVYRNALNGQPGRGEIRYRAKDGTEKVAYILSQPRYQEAIGSKASGEFRRVTRTGERASSGDVGGPAVGPPDRPAREVIGTTTIMVDVTRERNLERELQRAGRLELIGRLSSGVAHDFNNLLGVVLNLTDLARGHLPVDHPVHEDLKRIAEAGEQAAALAAQLLALSKQKPPSPRRVDVNVVIRRMLELLRATLPSSIGIEADLTPGEAAIQGDETQVQQVLMNLCLNARDAMPEGGILCVSTRVEPASGEGSEPSARVRLSVQDSGKGISEEMRSRIFEPFFSTREGGIGLGLAVVQQIVESFSGTIEVHSKAGEGARFDILWPMA